MAGGGEMAGRNGADDYDDGESVRRVCVLHEQRGHDVVRDDGGAKLCDELTDARRSHEDGGGA